jgi:hypothetical protein
MSYFGAEYTDFNGESLPNGATENLYFDLKVANGETSNSVECATVANCALKYSRDATPLLKDTVPSDVVQGDTV